MNINSNPLSLFLTKVAEGVALLVGGLLQNSLPDYCSITTSDSDYSLVTANGSLVSGFKVEGLITATGPSEFEHIMGVLVGALRPFLKDKGHTVQVFVARDQDSIGEQLQAANHGSRATLKSLKLQLDDVLDSRESNMSRFCSAESQYIAIWTRPEVLSAVEFKDASQKKMEAIKKTPSDSIKGGAQDLFATISDLRERHDSFVKSIESALGTDKAGFIIKALTCHEMVHVARFEQDPAFTPATWKPILPGDKLPGIFRGEDEQRPLSLADLQYPPLSWQLFPREARKIKNKYVELGDRIFAPVFIEIPSQQITPFSVLFEKLATVGIPFRASFTIDGGGMKYIAVKGGFASFLVWADPYNNKMHEAVTAMKKHAVEGATYVRFKIAFTTWAPIGDETLLRARVSKLVNAVTSWGNSEVREVTGSPVPGFYSTIPFLSHESIANPSVALLSDVVRMLPLIRQASPWKEGSILYRTKDGKLMPFEPGSSLQDTWNYILFAPPGSGKSVQIANLILAMVTQPGIKEIPLIGIIDIGPSSKGVINLIKDALPADQKHKVGYFKLKNTIEYSVNPFDTFLGCRFPTPEQRAFLINVLTQIGTPAERENAYSSISEVASQVIDDIYYQKSDSPRANPNHYEPSIEFAIDEKLSELNFQFTKTTSWWSVVDFLFDNGFTHLATLAQRHAVPNMTDIPAAARSPSMSDQYSDANIETGESLNVGFSRLITSGIKMYPILSGKTKFDLGEIRIASLDIEDIAKDGSVADDRQTALMYMVAKFILTRNYKVDKEFALSDSVPKRYRDHLYKMAIECKESLKWIVYDEFHRTKNSPSAQNAVLVDMREGRKWNLGVVLASQSLDDFPKAFKEFATGVFILKAATNAVADSLQSLFGLNDTTRAMILKYCTGPDNRIGAPMVLHLSLKTGQTDILVYSTLGAYELWALSSTPEDVSLMERVVAELSKVDPLNASVTARKALSTLLPGGAKAKVAEVKRTMSLSADEQEGNQTAIQNIANQFIDYINKENRRKR